MNEWRDGVKRLNAIVLAIGCIGATVSIATLQTHAAPTTVPDKVVPLVRPFPLTDVRLLDGPFKQAMQLDAQYLLSLEPDRLLHNFRVTAGLPSSAAPLGGWEAPDVELRGTPSVITCRRSRSCTHRQETRGSRAART